MHISIDKSHGYEYFIDSSCKIANSNGRVYLHRYIASIARGRWLRSDEVVHHIDGNRTNNVPENLDVMTRRSHARLHRPAVKEIHKCSVCGKNTRNITYCSSKCRDLGYRRVVWPSKEQLVACIDKMSWTAIGRKYGVSDNAVRKWAKKYKIMC